SASHTRQKVELYRNINNWRYCRFWGRAMSITWFKKAVILASLTILAGGAEIASANMITQSQSFSGCSVTPCLSLSFNKFDPSLGSLTGVEIDLTSIILETAGYTFHASAGSSLSGLLNGSTFIGTGNGTTGVEYDSATHPLPFASYSGLGTFNI